MPFAQIHMIEGRTEDQKRAVIEKVTQALHEALVQQGHRVHTAALEQFQTTPATRQVFILAATYGDGQAPAHARRSERMSALVR